MDLWQVKPSWCKRTPVKILKWIGTCNFSLLKIHKIHMDFRNVVEAQMWAEWHVTVTGLHLGRLKVADIHAKRATMDRKITSCRRPRNRMEVDRLQGKVWQRDGVHESQKSRGFRNSWKLFWNPFVTKKKGGTEQKKEREREKKELADGAKQVSLSSKSQLMPREYTKVWIKKQFSMTRL